MPNSSAASEPTARDLQSGLFGILGRCDSRPNRRVCSVLRTAMPNPMSRSCRVELPADNLPVRASEFYLTDLVETDEGISHSRYGFPSPVSNKGSMTAPDYAARFLSS